MLFNILQIDYVKGLVEEARNLSTRKYHATDEINYNTKDKIKKIGKFVNRHFQNDSEMKENIFSAKVENINEKSLLQSVESLILAIKSGKLVEEQERSNVRIQNILNTVVENPGMSYNSINQAS